MVRRAERGDETALSALARLAEYVGAGRAGNAALFDPDVIVRGGCFTAVARWIMDPVRTALAAGLLASPSRERASRLSSTWDAPPRPGTAPRTSSTA
ncbi:ROK family protein [Streptomyces sp. NPDC013157]|uniref:ROK family protein n=1 Tax=Streptomyces sp. NPDC013157 TaxID=3364861 RepID=UPI003699CE1B